MSFKKAKFISGLLSVTALASAAAAPVMAEEVMKTDLSIKGADQEEDQNREKLSLIVVKDKSAKVGTIQTFTGRENSAEETDAAECENVLSADLISSTEEKTGDQDESADVNAADVDVFYVEAVKAYNHVVLPELSVSLAMGNAITGMDFSTPKSELAFEKAQSTVQEQKPSAAEQKLVVASPNVYLNIHEEPSLGSEVVGKMYGNDIAVELRRENDRWTRIRSGNVVGYVMNEYLVEGDQAQALSEIVGTQLAKVEDGDNGEIYQEASDTARIIANADEGDQYEVTESEDGWIGILTDDGEGFIPASEVTLSMAYPVAESTREEEDRISRSNVKERADHEQRKADKADAVAALAQTRAQVASDEEEETAMAVVQVTLRAAEAAAAQAEVAEVAVSQAGEESGQAVIEFATQFVGNPYVWGGSSLTHGADCSGFVMAVYGNFGFRLPHYDVSDRSVGSPVASLAEARAGDIICYNGHVALYMGDGMIVHAQDERHGITTSRADFMHIVCIRRLFN